MVKFSITEMANLIKYNKFNNIFFCYTCQMFIIHAMPCHAMPCHSIPFYFGHCSM